MLSELHVQGGTPFMLPIDLVGIINLGLIGYLLFTYFTKKSISETLLDRLKHLGGLALAVGAFGTLAGLFTAWIEQTVIGAGGVAYDLSPLQRCLLAARALWFYLGKLVWPSDLTFIYPRWTIDPTHGFRHQAHQQKP